MSGNLFQNQVYEAIRSTWEWARNRPNAGHPYPAPDVSTLAALIDPVFRVSLQREEGRELQLTVVHMEPTPAQVGRIFTLKNPLEYYDKNLRKLAASFDPSSSALLVNLSPGKTDPLIWGFGYFGTNFSRNLPVHTGYESGWPENLNIKATAPGVVAIGRGTGSLGVIECGNFIPPVPTPLYSAAMGNRLIALISQDPGYVKHAVYYWQTYNRALQQLLHTVNRVTHGATIVLVPPAHQTELSGKYHGGFVPSGSFQISEILIRRLENSLKHGGMIENAALGERLDERIAGVAQLACIDGALLLTTELEVIAFGAKIDARPWKGQVVVGPDGFKTNGQPFDLARHGTRHGSAAAIVAECDHVVAFVSSADGPIRGFAKDGTTPQLICWPDFRVSMFTHDTF